MESAARSPGQQHEPGQQHRPEQHEPGQHEPGQQHEDSTSGDPFDAVEALLADAGVHSLALRRVLALLAAGGRTRAELVRRTATPRRTVDELLAAARGHLHCDGAAVRLQPEQVQRYRARFDLDDPRVSAGAESLRETGSDDPGTDRGPGTDGDPGTDGGCGAGGDLRTGGAAGQARAAGRAGAPLELLRGFIAAGPRPDRDLDHVTATAETVLARARWLHSNYDLTGARLLCLGDHDLTSLAVGLLAPSAEITAVDVDERILRHIDVTAAEHGLPVRTLHADLRRGLPPALQEWADLAFSDPPYTPEGMTLFATRALEGMAGAHSRLHLAYGFSARTPALGRKVQQELLRLGFVFTAVLPDFHRYHGAEAVGSASDLYVCQPTSQARRQGRNQQAAIYTHGARSVEGGASETSADFRARLGERLGTTVEALREPDWSRPVRGRDPVFDLRDDPGAWLLRMLLACNSPRPACVVDNNHPDITSAAAQRDLAELIGPKYALRMLRSFPERRTAVVLAERINEPSAARDVLGRAHGKLGNIVREALITHAAEPLSKRQAKDRAAALLPVTADAQLRLVDLPRHRIAELLAHLPQPDR
ncbi:bis-aminopropyl spermidine synthase family protein [Bounagaea algeriensis]